MTDFIPRDHYHALVRTLGSGPALRAILGDQDEVLVIETSEDGPPRTVHVIERCNDGQIRERPPGLPWPMLPPDSGHLPKAVRRGQLDRDGNAPPTHKGEKPSQEITMPRNNLTQPPAAEAKNPLTETLITQTDEWLVAEHDATRQYLEEIKAEMGRRVGGDYTHTLTACPFVPPPGGGYVCFECGKEWRDHSVAAVDPHRPRRG